MLILTIYREWGLWKDLLMCFVHWMKLKESPEEFYFVMTVSFEICIKPSNEIITLSLFVKIRFRFVKIRY